MAAATPGLIAYVGRLAGPFCGVPEGDARQVLRLFCATSAVATALEQATTDGTAAVMDADGDDEQRFVDVRSVALIPLRRGAAPDPFGLLALGSAAPRRVHDGMGADFLARIGENASAALTRLLR